MLFLKDPEIKQYTYTKITVPITLEQCPSDDADTAYFLDVKCDSYAAADRYIGTQKTERIVFQRKRSAMDAMTVPQWDVEITLAEGLTEREVCSLLDVLCDRLTLACCKTGQLFQYGGITGFTYRVYEIRRSYANEKDCFGGVVLNQYCGPVEIRTCSRLPQSVFDLPTKPEEDHALSAALNRAFLTAMKSGDAVSRFILLYYLFELLYATDAYQNIKRDYEKQHPGVKMHPDQKRGELLCRYFKQVLHINEYQSFDQCCRLTAERFCDIITARNDLTHRADTSRISNLMYRHMIPILQAVIRTV